MMDMYCGDEVKGEGYILNLILYSLDVYKRQILHHVVGYVCDYAQMAVCIVGMLDNHHLLAFEHQGFVAHIDF